MIVDVKKYKAFCVKALENCGVKPEAAEAVADCCVMTDMMGITTHGTVNLPMYNSSTSLIVEAVVGLFDRIADPNLLVRRLNLVACHILPEHLAVRDTGFAQLDFFSDPEEDARKEQQEEELKREKRRQQAVLTIKKKFGKNAIVKGMNLEEGATAMDRNGQIGGHKA